MTFRDDHDAALARADALERELARAREDAAAKDAQLDDAEREKQRLARELDEARSKPAPSPVERPKQRTPRSSSQRDRPWWSIPHRERPVAFYVIVLLLVGAIFGRFAWDTCNQPSTEQRR
jgi:hypothetical protein